MKLYFIFIFWIVEPCNGNEWNWLLNENNKTVDIIRKPSNTTEEELPVLCPNGFTRFEEYCYRTFPQRFSWLEAIMFCRLVDLDLAKLRTQAQYDFLKSHLSGLSVGSYDRYGNRQGSGLYAGTGFWLRATDSYLPGHWVWIDDKSGVDFGTWGKIKPSSTTGGCLGLSKSSAYDQASFQCGESTLHPICEKRTRTPA